MNIFEMSQMSTRISKKLKNFAVRALFLFTRMLIDQYLFLFERKFSSINTLSGYVHVGKRVDEFSTIFKDIEYLPLPDGSNISICILDYKKIRATKRLIESIPLDFNGEVNILSQGNDEKHLDELKQFVAKFKNINLFMENQNLGIAAGRNLVFAKSTKPWILSLDNDIVFKQSPFEHLTNLILQTNAKFANLSFSDGKGKPNNGANLVFENLGRNSVVKLRWAAGPANLRPLNRKDVIFLGNALNGGASLYNSEVFQKLGGFDEYFKFAFEDLDFSLRLVLNGYKIANSNFHSLFHLHDHTNDSVEIDYEKEHSNLEKYLAADAILIQKYNVSFIDKDFINWLKNRVKLT